jgi:hypothetical protein
VREFVLSLPVVLGFLFGVLWAVLVFLALRSVAARFVNGRGASQPADAWVPIIETGSVVNVRGDCLHAKAGSALGVGSIDAVGEMLDGAFKPRLDRFVLEPRAQVYIGGWAAADTHTPALAACFVLDGVVRSDAGATYGGFRPDVAAAFHAAALAPSGYVLTLPRSGLAKGIHRIGVAVVSSAGTVTMLATPVTFRVP